LGPEEGIAETLGAGDRFVVSRPLSDTAGGHVGVTGTVIWANECFPFAQLSDGTLLNLLEDDYLEYAPDGSTRGVIPLVTISHDRTMWNEGFEHDIYLQLPAADLEGEVRALIARHNAAQTGYGRDFEVSVHMGQWEGPDLDHGDARRIILEALNEWQGI
jgi:hypothetical protein